MTHKGNNIIPNAHFHKKWQKRIKTWFNQPARKYRRRMSRKKKALAITPRPTKRLRPAVRCPTIRYHTKIRHGRGFTLKEIRRVGLTPQFARSIGIAVDWRRINKSYESLAMNVQILREYMQRLILFPVKKKIRNTGMPVKEASADQQKMAVQLNRKSIVPLKDTNIKYKAHIVSEEEKKFSAFALLRKARIDMLLLGKRTKLMQEALENPEGLSTVKGKKKKEQ